MGPAVEVVYCFLGYCVNFLFFRGTWRVQVPELEENTTSTIIRLSNSKHFLLFGTWQIASWKTSEAFRFLSYR